MHEKFEARWPGLSDEINGMVRDLIERGHDGDGIAVGLLLAGAEMLVELNGPQVALGAIEGIRGRLRDAQH